MEGGKRDASNFVIGYLIRIITITRMQSKVLILSHNAVNP